MWKAIAQIIATALGWGRELWQRKVRKDDDPVEQDKKRRSEIAREILENDEGAANRRLADDLARVRVNKSLPGHSGGPDGKKD